MKSPFLLASTIALAFAASPALAQDGQHEHHKDKPENSHQVTSPNPPNGAPSNQGNNDQSHFSSWQHRNAQSHGDTHGIVTSTASPAATSPQKKDYNNRNLSDDNKHHHRDRNYDRNRNDNDHTYDNDRNRHDYDRHDYDRNLSGLHQNWSGRNAHPDFRRHNVYAQHHYRYRGARWYWPRGYSYQRWTFGMTLPAFFWAREYWIGDYYDYGLAPPPPGCVWVRYGNDAILIDQVTGEILEVVYDQFY